MKSWGVKCYKAKTRMGLDSSNPFRPATADTSFQWPDSHKWDEADYALHQDVVTSQSGRQKMRRMRTGQDLSLQSFWKEKKRKGYGAGPSKRAQRKLKPFVLSTYGRWLQATKIWVRALCQKAIRSHLKGGTKGGVLAQGRFQGPAMAKMGMVVGVKRMQGNLRVYESGVGHMRPRGGVGSPPAGPGVTLQDMVLEFANTIRAPGDEDKDPPGNTQEQEVGSDVDSRASEEGQD